MRNLGLARLRSISGVHITIVVACTMWLIRKALARLPWIAARVGDDTDHIQTLTDRSHQDRYDR